MPLILTVIQFQLLKELLLIFQRINLIKDELKSGRPKSVTNDDKDLDVLQAINDNPCISVSKTTQQNDISATSVRQILRRHYYHLYKMHQVQQLSEDDYDRRVEFCDNDNKI